jgi:hypothetical protein
VVRVRPVSVEPKIYRVTTWTFKSNKVFESPYAHGGEIRHLKILIIQSSNARAKLPNLQLFVGTFRTQPPVGNASSIALPASYQAKISLLVLGSRSRIAHA